MLVDGIAQAGDVGIMSTLKPGVFEVIGSDAGCFEKAITHPPAAEGPRRTRW